MRERTRGLESAAALVACTLAAVLISRRLLRPDVVSDDALVHQYWMWHFRDAALFNDPLTAELRGSTRYPDGYELLYRLAAHVFDPIAFGEWVGVALMALSGWLIFLIVREHTDWRPAAWIAAGVFLALINIHRFHGGFPRAFVHPVVLLTVLMSMRRHFLVAALVAAGGALFYPPASLLAVGVLAFSAVEWSGLRLRLERDRTLYALLAGGLALLAVLGPAALDGGAPRVFTAARGARVPGLRRARAAALLRGDAARSTCARTAAGSTCRARGACSCWRAWRCCSSGAGTCGCCAARCSRCRSSRSPRSPPRRRCCSSSTSPTATRIRSSHSSRSSSGSRCARRGRRCGRGRARGSPRSGCCALRWWSTCWRSTRSRSARASRSAISGAPRSPGSPARCCWPPRPRSRSAGSAAGAHPALGAALTGLVLLVALLGVPDRTARGSPCPTGPAARFLGTLPKDAIVAGDPYDLKCVPFTARRAVVISTQLAPAYEVEYFLHGRARLYADLRAYYGSSVDAIVDLRRRYGATHLWVRRAAIENEMRKQNGQRWHPWQDPYGRYVRGLLRSGEPAVLHLPGACRRWHLGGAEVYDIACIARTQSTNMRNEPTS